MSKDQLIALDEQLRNRPSRMGLDVQTLRAGFATGITRELPTSIAAGELTVGGRPALQLARPGAAEVPVLLYFHGGGYVVGSPRTHAHLAAALIAQTGGRAVLPDYRLAPEHPFPAAVDDGLDAYQELLTAVDPRKLLIAGDSAGGGLALAVLLRARDAGLPLPAAVVVFSPFVDLTLSGATINSKAEADPMFSRARLEGFVQQYLPTGDRSVRDVSPALHDLRGLPPLLIQVGSHEVLLDDAVRLAAGAAAGDVDVRLEVTGGAPHVFQNYLLDEAVAALDRAGRFLADEILRQSLGDQPALAASPIRSR